MKEKKKQKKHIKMYADDKFIKNFKQKAEEEGLTQSAFLFLAAKKALKL